MRNVLADNPGIPPEALARTRDLMNTAVPDALVTGYQEIIPTLTLPDPNDRHVLAAAIVGRTDVIVTSNLKDFPAEVLQPDEFLMHQRDLNHDRFLECVKRIRARLVNPPLTPDEYIASLRRCQLVLMADALEGVRRII